MRSKVLQDILNKMENDPWHVKLRRWWRLKIWTYTCLTRKYWDKSFEGYIFKKKQSGGGIGRRILPYIMGKRIRSQGDTSYRFESCSDYKNKLNIF